MTNICSHISSLFSGFKVYIFVFLGIKAKVRSIDISLDLSTALSLGDLDNFNVRLERDRKGTMVCACRDPNLNCQTGTNSISDLLSSSIPFHPIH